MRRRGRRITPAPARQRERGSWCGGAVTERMVPGVKQLTALPVLRATARKQGAL
jgi:hypothetical protein